MNLIQLDDKLKKRIGHMRISDFDYELPGELIAQNPLTQRDASRMLVVDRGNGTWADSTFKAFPQYLRTDDVVVVNNTRVIPARLMGRRRGSGGAVEVFLVRQLTEGSWEVLIRPGGRLKQGDFVDFADELSAEVIDDPGKEIRKIRFESLGPFDEVLSRVGLIPLPPYIKRKQPSVADKERYQTIYARHAGAIAAPTAGLHFTPPVLSAVRERARMAEITLHVGYGTFEPVRVDSVKDHSVSTERFEIDEATAQTLNDARTNQARIIAIGTTTVRGLESSLNDEGVFVAQSGDAHLTITPGYKFRAVDVLLTNFHLPQSSLLLLVSAFAGKDLVLAAYRHAVAQCYRFYSYGDCMLIL